MKKWLVAIAIMTLIAFSMASASTLIIDGKTVDGTVVITTSSAPTPPPVPCPPGQHLDAILQKCVLDVPIPPPPVGVLGSKTNPYKLIYTYTPVSTGFTWRVSNPNLPKANAEFSLGAGQKVYLEIDPVNLKANANSFQMVVLGYNCPTLYIYKAYYDKNTQTYTDEVYFTSGGTLNYVASSASRPFSSTKFLYALENKGESWGIKLWVQMY